MSEKLNVANRLADMAKRIPHSNAIIQSTLTGYKKITYFELEQDSNRIASVMQQNGIGCGKRIALFVRYGIDFISLVFALFKTGATIILIDPGMGVRRMLNCLAEVEPDGMIAIPPVHFVRLLLRRKFPKSKHNIIVGRSWFLRGLTLDKIRRNETCTNFNPVAMSPDAPAAIIFTSGSTGPPKGVEFTHRIFDTQINEIAARYEIITGDIDLACFPLFGLFDPAMGVTAVIPNIDPTKPAKANPAKIIRIANECKITQSFASPAIWNLIANYCNENKKNNVNDNVKEYAVENDNEIKTEIETETETENKIITPYTSSKISAFKIPTLKRAISAGAPVSASILQQLKPYIHPQGDIFTPYGATESLPTASISATEILSETVNITNYGGGVCVGQRFQSISWAIIEISDQPIPQLENATILPNGEIGELIVTGSQVTKKYINRPESNALAKITDANGKIWHRMGDAGYLDSKDRFWFCGRKAHRIETPEGTLFSIPCESIFNQHPAVFRSALANSPNGKPRIFIEPYHQNYPKSKKESTILINELLELAQKNQITKQIKEIRIMRNFPVDIRHNVKINRELLSSLR
ncbi:MAG: AMP-binding protein [Planctomycetaceae bacterium]|jgi:acyl-CoA synthetase (AMP-forming)/AMP-acid ligase II|nr:AMP-binding protein [Planctomycetaceae bacterium]